MPRLAITASIIQQAPHSIEIQQRNDGVSPELTSGMHAAIALNTTLLVLHLAQFVAALLAFAAIRAGYLLALRPDEGLHNFCQRNLASKYEWEILFFLLRML